jgi:putative ABC transport system permease protein
MLSDLLFRLKALFRRRALDAELDGELREHLDRLIHKHVAAGLPRDEAVRRARLEFGGLTQTAEACRDVRGISLVETTTRDLRYAARVLRRDAAFTAIAFVTLALGIGATTTVFSVVRAILLKPLPYGEVDRVVMPLRQAPPGVELGFDEIPWGRVDFLAEANSTRAFSALGAFRGDSFNLTGSGEPVRLEGLRASAGFFPALGVAPELGRWFTAEEDEIGREHEVVLSDRVWRERFSGDSSIVGRAIDLNGAPYAVVGVMPPEFTFPRASEMPGSITLPRETELWVPLALPRGGPIRGEPSELAVVGRLARGVTATEAQAELDLFARDMERQIPAGKGWFDSRVTPLARQVTGETRRPLLLLLAAVLVVLLVACFNVASLLLTRAIARGSELTLRAALGAGRGRLVRQLVTESVLLAVVGGSGGIVCAFAGVSFVRAFAPATIPRLDEVRLDPAVLAFAVAVSVATGILFGLAPALVAARADLSPALKEAARSSGGGRGLRLRNALLVVEIALAVVLIIASVLLGRTFGHLLGAKGGFDADRVLTFELTLPTSRYPDLDRIVRLYHDALERLRQVPGVVSAGVSEVVPLDGAGESTAIRLSDRPTPVSREEVPFANYTILSPGYLAAVGTPVLRGRDFLESDTAEAMPVAIVNEALARKYWPGQDALGKPIRVPINKHDRTIVGIVADVKHLSVREAPAPEMFVPYTQKPWPSMQTMHVAVRTGTDPVSMAAATRAAIQSVDPELPLARVTTLAAIVDEAVAPPRFSMLLVSAFGAVALVLACVGLYGAVSYAVVERTQEIGIRLALGASRANVYRLVIGKGVQVTLLGLVLGLVAAAGILRAISGFLYGVEATDPATFAVVSGALVAVSLAALFVPARRATRVGPIVALRRD